MFCATDPPCHEHVQVRHQPPLQVVAECLQGDEGVGHGPGGGAGVQAGQARVQGPEQQRQQRGRRGGHLGAEMVRHLTQQIQGGVPKPGVLLLQALAQDGEVGGQVLAPVQKCQ